MPGVAFPPVGRLGLTSPPSRSTCYACLLTLGTMLGYDCRLLFSMAFTRRSPTDTLFVPSVRVLSSSSLALRNACTSAWPAWSPGTPLPGCSQGSKWLSQVPRLSLCMHAPLLDPGGVLLTRPIVPRTAAFHWHDSVGFPQKKKLLVYPVSTIIQISRLNHAACILAYPGSGLPLPGLPAGFATSLLARL